MMRRVGLSLLALASLLPSFAAMAGDLTPAAPVCNTTEARTAPPVSDEDLFTPAWQTKSACTDACAADFAQCLDGCDSWPYPGCVNDCRYQRNLCIQECF